MVQCPLIAQLEEMTELKYTKATSHARSHIVEKVTESFAEK